MNYQVKKKSFSGEVRRGKGGVKNKIEGEFIDINYEVPSGDYFENPKKKDGVVLVPFVGTGSECAAAKELGQSYIGFEINPDYVRLAEKMVGDKKSVAKLF